MESPDADLEAYLRSHERKDLLRFITCGSVDDGKSTLIGRLLYETKQIFDDQLAALESDSRPTSLKPDSLTPTSTMSPMVVIDRSRTGRVIMPAWQKRQPRVHPRKISTLKRSWTVSASGTNGFLG